MKRNLLLMPAVLLLALLAPGCERVQQDIANLQDSAKKERKPPTVTTGTVDIGPSSQYPAGSANTRFDEVYGFVVTNDSGAVLAIRTVCTHDGHFVTWTPSGVRFTCAADRCEYDLKGTATHSPAFKNLNSIPATKNPDGTLTVDLDKLYAKPVPIVPKK